MRVLIVDDEPLELDQLAFLIADKYPLWDVYKAEDAVQAKKILKTKKMDLALLDIHLPGESGLDLCLEIKKEYKIECIMITAYEEFQYAKKAIRLNVFDYIVKPVISREFYQVLDRFTQKHGYLKGISPFIQQVLDIIHHEYKSKLNLQELADRVHVSPTYLSRKFSEELGKSFQEYLVSYRIKEAKKLLKEKPNWSIQQISQETGFSSLNHFSHTFKKKVQLSPRQYKEQLNHD